MQYHRFKQNQSKKATINYLLYLPKNQEQNPQQKLPIILFLHGSEERGNDLNMIKAQGIPQIIENGEDLPFIVIAPQCPKRTTWISKNDILMALIDDIVERYNADSNKVYLTGLSMGGYGTWALACLNPNKFAAIAPICGGGDQEKLHAIKHVPIWTFHGAKDQIVPIKETKKLVDTLKNLDGKIKFTIYPDAEHDSWTETYTNPEFYKWLLQH